MRTDIFPTATIQALLTLSCATILYLIYSYLNYFYFHFDFVLLGVIHEIAVIPCMVLQPILLLVSIVMLFVKSDKKLKLLLGLSIAAHSITIVSLMNSFNA